MDKRAEMLKFIFIRQPENRWTMNENTPTMLSRRGQQWLKALHITLAALSLGGSMVALILLAIKQGEARFHFDFTIDYVNYHLFNGLIFYTFLGNLITALTYALYTHWGFIRFRWLMAKWIIMLALLLVVLVFFAPAVNGLVGLSDSGLHQGSLHQEYERLQSQAAAAAMIMVLFFLAIFVISAVRPWGKQEKDIFANIRRARFAIISLAAVGLFFSIFNGVQLNKLRGLPIDNVDFAQLPDGEYAGVFEGGGGPYQVLLEVREGKLVDARLEVQRDSRYVQMAERVLPRVIEQQALQVDAITGATTTSKCILKAAEKALKDRPQ